MGSSQWRPVFVIFISLVVDLLGFTVILPLLPSMLDYYSLTDETGLYNASLNSVDTFRKIIKAPEMDRLNIVLFGGFIGSLYSLLQFFSSPIMGATSDIFGRKPILLLSTLGVLVSYVLWSVSYSFPVFILSRVVAGVSKGIVSISTALVTDVTTTQDRPKAMGLIGVAFSVGFIFGPLIGAYFSIMAKPTAAVTSTDFAVFQYPAYFSCLTALVVLFMLTFYLTETLSTDKRAKSLGGGLSDAFSLFNPVSLFKFSSVSNISKSDISKLRWIGFTYFLYLFLFSGLEHSLTFLVHQRFNYTR
jgi:MFS family permease